MEKHDVQSSFQSRIRIEDDVIFCDYNNENLHRFTLKEIVAIGLHTNWKKPPFKYSYVDFVTSNNAWFWIPLYADNANSLVDYLQEHFRIHFKQILSTVCQEWSSTVVFPDSLKDKPIFKVLPTENYNEPKTSFDRLLARIGMGGFNTVTTIDLTDEIREEMAKASR